MIESIERDGTKVVIKINTGLEGIGKRWIHFHWDTGSEMFAELLKYQIWEQLNKFKKEIALKPHHYLEPGEISKLKSMLVKEWDGSKHDWKWGN